MTTFGFEAEFQTGADDLVAALHRRGYASSPRLHGYHCDCDDCSFYSNYPFRGQTDSSCSGEIISSVFMHDAAPVPSRAGISEDLPVRMDARPCMELLEELAVECDAVPGMNSGFHVHVGVRHLNTEQQAATVWAFIKWEPLLCWLAVGRFSDMRAMNRAVRENMGDQIRRYASHHGGGTLSVRDSIRFLDGQPSQENDYDNWRTGLYLYQRENDRHSNLNTRSLNRHGTFEYRLWNSTRSAWRIELFTRLSVALVDPDVVDWMNAHDVIAQRAAGHANDLIDYLGACGHDRAAELTQRQVAYCQRDEPIPSSLTVL